MLPLPQGETLWFYIGLVLSVSSSWPFDPISSAEDKRETSGDGKPRCEKHTADVVRRSLKESLRVIHYSSKDLVLICRIAPADGSEGHATPEPVAVSCTHPLLIELDSVVLPKKALLLCARL